MVCVVAGLDIVKQYGIDATTCVAFGMYRKMNRQDSIRSSGKGFGATYVLSKGQKQV
jgi:hypothetical protein